MRNSKLSLGAAAILAMSSVGFITTPAEASVVVNTFPVTWVLQGCSQLPPGTILDGTGTLVDKVTTLTNGDVTSTKNDDHAKGTAVDRATGKVYKWTYDNVLEVKSIASHPHLLAGEMTDKFRLSGDGPLRLRNGFAAVYVEDKLAGTFGIYPESAYGDPFDFPSGTTPHCDPL
jgi:hypothetical protein